MRPPVNIFRGMAPSGRTWRARRFRGDGFSLVEMILVILLVGILFGFGSILLTKVFGSYALERNISDADWQAKVALERMARELRAARSATAADLDVASGTQIRFIDTDGNGVCFYRDAATNRLMRSGDGPSTACGTTGPQPLADNISSLGFTYWRNDGAAAAAATQVYYIAVSLSVANATFNSDFRTNVRPRNF